MKKNNNLSFSEPRRQSEYAIILILIKFIRNFVRQAWPLLLIFVFSKGDFLTVWFSVLFIGIAAISLFGSVLAYFKFYYYIRNNELHIEKGILRKTHTNVPFERIQSIDFQQNIVHQFFGVVSLKIDTAGSKQSEISFDALTTDQAEVLRNYILKEKRKVDKTEDLIVDDTETEDAEELLLSLSVTDLLKVGISQNHLRTAGIILVFFVGILENLEQALPFDVFDRVNEEAEMWVRSSLVFVLIMIPLFLIVSFIITLIRTSLKYYNLKFFKTGKGFKLISGLLNRKESTAQIAKIQLISWSTNPIQRLFRIFTLRLYKADSADVLGEKSITVPGSYEHHVLNVKRLIFPGEEQAVYASHRMHWLLMFRYLLFTGLLPCLGGTILAYVIDYPLLYWIWLYFPIAIWMSVQYYRKRRVKLHPDYLISKSGVFGIAYKLMEGYKVQCVMLSQRFFQRRRDLANLYIFTAAGSISFQYLPMTKAQAIYDYLIYRVESDNREWM